MVALVICGVTLAPTGLPARVLGFRPLAYVGRISYGLYLWHWPVFLVLDGSRTGLTGYPLFAVRVAVTFVIAIASWYLVETPVRQMTFRGWRSWAWVPVGAVAAATVLVVTTSTAGAATNILVPKNQVAAQVHTYEYAPFPKGNGKVRVLVVGDSVSLTVGFWMTPYAAQYGAVLRGRPLDGCGLVTSNPYDLHGQPTYPLAPCAQWPQIWGSDVATMHPQVVLLVVGWWETMDRVYQGRWQHLGEPSFNAYERSRLEQAVSVLGFGGRPGGHCHRALFRQWRTTGRQGPACGFSLCGRAESPCGLERRRLPAHRHPRTCDPNPRPPGADRPPARFRPAAQRGQERVLRGARRPSGLSAIRSP